MSIDFDKVTRSYSDILTVSKTPSAAGDISLVFSYMKMLDPDSTVREGEQATAKNARGVPEVIRSLYARMLTGETLGINQRADFVSQANALYQSSKQMNETRAEEYRSLAKRLGANPDNVAIKRGLPGEQKITTTGTAPKDDLDLLIDSKLKR